MKKFNKIKGDIGEELTKDYYVKKKYKILARNYKNKVGEIDIIAQKKNEIVFIEVKTRSSTAYGAPSEAVDYKKQQKIRRVAQNYIIANHLLDFSYRFDVAEVLDGEVSVIENAF